MDHHDVSTAASTARESEHCAAVAPRAARTCGQLLLVLATTALGCVCDSSALGRGLEVPARVYGADAVEVFLEEAPPAPVTRITPLAAIAATSMLTIRELQEEAAARGLDGIDDIDCAEPAYVACTARGFAWASPRRSGGSSP